MISVQKANEEILKKNDIKRLNSVIAFRLKHDAKSQELRE